MFFLPVISLRVEFDALKALGGEWIRSWLLTPNAGIEELILVFCRTTPCADLCP